ncbi:TetR/AcrR family transcriptional regulator [Streptomonospora nanhaiensis]|uniref:AcrR family transcriptional regulator n=1 Tax=Streptomonospora nanhaiensis TaxID=1323731 RepID=A0A853BR47_9ACTN|nr:TetR/AcrR family transcriptional regulator [Streptomonospora nanhaiensis]MBV2366988.1 TetR/AcrR family transcriptional regulator [Streptomonospora nanhaiensis]MBX9390147.1 TetR/AcrR family transcriptional regulator [Streptomonospora nanhaiensis]NYI97166.1 AcrR family transcriptional regulator [Streptomonospora nanhaiensis]
MATTHASAPGGDRRRQRRAATKAEILRIAVELMAAEGAGGLSLSAIARRMGIQPPSLYKYFASRNAVYDALFAEGQRAFSAALREGAEGAPPGLPALEAGVTAGLRWAVEHPPLAQLLFWRPVPGFAPSAESYAPALEAVGRIADLVAGAVREGHLHPDAATDEGREVLAVLLAGVVTQQLANEPGTPFAEGRFSRRTPVVLEAFRLRYPPDAA